MALGASGNMLFRNIFLLRAAACLLAALVPAAAFAALPSIPKASPAASPPAQTPAPAPAISANTTDDAQLAGRIRSIFTEIPALRAVRVRVSSGVVTLSGDVADDKAIDQAEGIASRVSGVVTVQNGLTRNLAVEHNLDPALSGVTAKAQGFVRALPLIGVAILVAVLLGALGYAIARQKRLWDRVAPNPFLAELMATAIRFAFVIAGIVLGLQILGATALLGAVLGGAGVIGIALGFAVRDSIDNYVSSVMLSVRQPFRANDFVRIDTYEGKVVRLTSRATILITPDGNMLRIPNATVFKAVILNFTANPERRFSFDYSIAEDMDPCHAQSTALDTLAKLDFVLPSPAPLAEIVEVAGQAQQLRFHAWVDQTRTDFGKGRTRAIEAVHGALRGQGFSPPEPEYRVHLDREGRRNEAEEQPDTLPAGDVAPERHLDKMVSRERAADDTGPDLLDTGRPVE